VDSNEETRNNTNVKKLEEESLKTYKQVLEDCMINGDKYGEQTQSAKNNGNIFFMLNPFLLLDKFVILFLHMSVYFVISFTLYAIIGELT